MKLSVCLIVKDVAPFIERCLGSIVDQAFEFVIVDTGSSDASPAVITSFCARHARPLTYLHFNPETHPQAFLRDVRETWNDPDLPGPFTGNWMLADFGAARQLGWDRVSPEADYILWLDSDDVAEGVERLPEIMADMQQNKIDSAFIGYDYAHDAQGNVSCHLVRERILRRGGAARWQQPIHEVLLPPGAVKFYDGFKIVHHRDECRPSTPGPACRNLKVLLKWRTQFTDETVDPRLLFYLGNEFKYILPERALPVFKLYCARSGWDEERALAHHFSGNILEGLGRHAEALAEYGAAVLEDGINPDPMFGAARVAYHKKDWQKCIEWTERGFETARRAADRPSALMRDPLDRTFRPHLYYSVALREVGRLQEALASCAEGMKWNPSDVHLLNVKKDIEQKLSPPALQSGQQMRLQFKLDEPLSAPPQSVPPAVLTIVAIQMWKRLRAAGDAERALCFLDSLPAEVDRDAIAAARRSMEPQKLDIIIYTGPAWEEWSPNSIATGLGGSELAAVYMARELAARGHKVRVLGHPGSQAGVYDGVEYVQYDQGPRACDILIASRQVGVLQAFKAKRKFVWVHDVDLGDPQAVKSALPDITGFFCLSNWHKQHFMSTYPFVPDSKVIVTRNGLDLTRFNAEPIKRGNRLIYASSPDRGLLRLLDLFPRIRARVPDAELHVYYGFVTWEAIARARGLHEFDKIGTQEFEKIAEYKRRIAETPGVVFHDRVGQKELAEAYSAAKVWSAPNWFSETSCISAMEAQAAGCVPVTTRLAALNETVQHGVLLSPPSESPAYGDAFVDSVVDLLCNEEHRRATADAGRRHAFEHLAWRDVAVQWEGVFTEAHAAAPAVKVSVGKRPLRVALVLGRQGASVHGVLDIERAFEASFATGTVSGFFNIAWGLAELGHTVDAFCDTPRPVVGCRRLGGANFYPLESDIDVTYDVYMSINEPDLLRPCPKDKLRVCVQWQNDFTYCRPGFDESVDVYVCPSVRHSRQIAACHIDEKKLDIVPLSANLEFFGPAPGGRRRGSIAYCSSPDRGLHHLLAMFPELKRRVPEANLKIYYRFQPWYESVINTPNLAGTEDMRRAQEINSALGRLGRDGSGGVTLVGPVPPKTLAEELCATQAMVYTCDPMRFTEGFSTAVLDACAAGCVPIVTAVDALPEVYGGAAVLIDPVHFHSDPLDYRPWLDTIVKALTDEDYATGIRVQARSRALSLSRKAIAKQWEELIRRWLP